MRLNTDDRAEAGERLLFSSLRLASVMLAVCAALLLLLLAGDPLLAKQLRTGLPKFFASRQDVPVAATMIAFFLLMAGRKRSSAGLSPALRPWQALSIIMAVTLTAWIVRVFVLSDFDLTRDEQMVAFDSAIYGRGLIFAPFPPEWREWYDALNTSFILPIGDREGWVSAYLPGNAAIHALFEHIVPPSLVSPLLLLVAGLALWRIARRLWPDSAGTQGAVLLLFAGSSQVILTATTRYAMTAHLAVNLVWLWLFLQRRPAAHAAAIALGFVGTGLHQPLFHPIFVIPFLDLLRRERRWRLLSAYVLCYAAIGLFWLSWPGWVSGHGLHDVPIEFRPEGVSYLDRLHTAVAPLTSLSFGLMGVNLLRFFAWQHLLLAPILIVGLRAAFTTDPLCRALASGMVLLVLGMLVLLPTQVHGWGYRYLHGFIGSAVLIAGFGWHRLEKDGIAPSRILLLATALSLLLLLPLHAWMARAMVTPYAEARATLAHMRSEIVIVDDRGPPFASDLVLNRPDLQNRPILLQASLVSPSSLVRLCAGGSTLSFADAPRFAAIYRFFGESVPNKRGPAQQRLYEAAQGAGCRVISFEQASAKGDVSAGQYF